MYLLAKQDVSAHEIRALELILFLTLFVMTADILVQITEPGFLVVTASIPLTPFFSSPSLGGHSLSILYFSIVFVVLRYSSV